MRSKDRARFTRFAFCAYDRACDRLAKQFAASVGRRDRWCHCVGLFVCRLRCSRCGLERGIIPKRIKHRIEPKQGRSERHIRRPANFIRNRQSFCKRRWRGQALPFAPPPGRGSRSTGPSKASFSVGFAVIARFDRANARLVTETHLVSARSPMRRWFSGCSFRKDSSSAARLSPSFLGGGRSSATPCAQPNQSAVRPCS